MSMKNVPAMPTILLFDIDGTLVDTGGAGRRAMETAFARAGQLPGKMNFSFGGMTDRAIVRTALGAAGRRADESSIDRVIELYLALLPTEVEASTTYRTLPNVHALLGDLANQPELAIGLGTGNVERGANIKLARADLGASFAFGGFGCDSEDRAELLAVGAERGARALGRPRAACRVVVIGDTLRDVDAAVAIGAECVAVATGGVPIEELRASAASAVFPDLGAEGIKSALVPSIS